MHLRPSTVVVVGHLAFTGLASLLVVHLGHSWTEAALAGPVQPGPHVEVPRSASPAPALLDAELLGRMLKLPGGERAAAHPVADDCHPVQTLRLLGTLLDAARPEASLAAMEERATGRARTCRAGDSVLGLVVVSIERGRVTLRHDDHEDALVVGPADERLAGTVAAVLAPAPTWQRAPGDYEVPRGEVMRALDNLTTLSSEARVVPSFKGGVAEGFRFFSVAPGGLLAKLGVKSGDLVRRINGFDLTSPERVLELYTKAREATRVEVELERGGLVERRTYRLR